MANESVLSGDAYKQNFDPAGYVKQNCRMDEFPGNDGLNLMPLMLSAMHDLYNKTPILQGRFLNLGTGPTIYQLISASKAYETITCSDFCDQNRLELWNCISDFDDYSTFDWTPHFKYVAALEGLEESNWTVVRDRTINSIMGIHQCDITKSSPMSPAYFRQFDCVSSELMFESVATSESHMMELMNNALTLLRPGGTWMQSTCLEYTPSFYTINGVRFQSYFITLEMAKRFAENVGLENIEYKVIDYRRWFRKEDIRKMLVLRATKKR